MVAKVNSGKDIKGALNYNEQKVASGDAVCIHANRFAKEVDQLTFYDKLNRFAGLNERNQRTRTNTLHVSLNFDPSEKLSPEDLTRIAGAYMDKIGFGEQPYLVYQHNDAAHPHIHIVTTLIQETGKRISIHFLGKNQSETARKEIEKAFDLVKAQGSGLSEAEMLKAVDAEKVIYGRSPTYQGIKRVVRAVVTSYKYTSLAELNAVLRRYNLTAERGSEKSQMFAKKGLLYSLIDGQGKRIGIPLKASAILGKPTLAFLERQFRLNQVLRSGHKDGLKTVIDDALRSCAGTKDSFRGMLLTKGIDAVFRTNAEGRLYGMTFIDERNKAVFKGSDLGKAYSAGAILERLAANRQERYASTLVGKSHVKDEEKFDAPGQARQPDVLKDLISPELLYSPASGINQRKRKRKRFKR